MENRKYLDSSSLGEIIVDAGSKISVFLQIYSFLLLSIWTKKMHIVMIVTKNVPNCKCDYCAKGC